ncbi:MAG: DAK2 domain-containing protein [Candidatus Limnocylindrales bacterium]|jgi:dihydroxyacetone kinase
MSAGRLRNCILAAADAVEASRDELGRLDAVAGDGDHGLTMAHGARAVRLAIKENPDAPPADLLAKVATAMGSIGGAIGPIYATALLKVAGVVRASAPGDGATVVQLQACADAAVTAVMALGHAKPGDKTVLDAMAPLAESLRASEAEGASVDAALVRARDAARAGAAATAGMIASIGRAARLGEQSRGTADAGATSFALIVGAAIDSYLESEGPRSPGAAA